MNEEKIIRLRKAKLGNSEIADKLGYSPQHVANVISKARARGEKIKPMIQKWTEEELNILRRGYRGKDAQLRLKRKGYSRTLNAIGIKRGELGLVE